MFASILVAIDKETNEEVSLYTEFWTKWYAQKAHQYS